VTEQTAGRAASPARRDASVAPTPAQAPDANAANAKPASADQKPQFSVSDVADAPALAPGVVLSGQMEESAFQEEPALVQKDGRFIQLTELLFLVVKNIDGKRTVDEIAAAVDKEHDKDISPDDVRKLIAEKLMPIGIVATRDGKVAVSQTSRSPLQLNMKMAMVSPALLKATTGVLQGLFFPVVLVPLVIFAFALVGWVFFVHGIAASIHDAFYTPGLLLLTFGIIVVSAAFHELGHAAGLRKGGKLPRAMGAGLYLVYPAFYTDVSENYQLKRWARVRTDLGGFYFNLIFAIGVVAAFFATGWEYLLFIVALICFEIVHQLLPFVRLDGYWALADMLGIPDFFSQMGAFIRSVLPLRFGKGRKMPPLKWWARAAFALYIVIVVPLLAFLLFGMVKGFPRIIATAFDAAGQQLGQLGGAIGQGQLLLAGALLLQLLFIGLSTLGVVMLLFNLGRSLVRLVWGWGKRSRGHAAIASLGSLAAALLLVFLWVPHVGPVAGFQSGGLWTQVGEFRPIASGERGGTIGQAVPGVDQLLRGIGVAPEGSGSPSPSPSPSGSPSGSPSTAPSPSTTPAATVAPFVPTAAPRTAAPTLAPTVAPATAAPTATP
jgi:putative peptide zinc metalloprotease protein